MDLISNCDLNRSAWRRHLGRAGATHVESCYSFGVNIITDDPKGGGGLRKKECDEERQGCFTRGAHAIFA
jgi:hypothetical protein